MLELGWFIHARLVGQQGPARASKGQQGPARASKGARLADSAGGAGVFRGNLVKQCREFTLALEFLLCAILFPELLPDLHAVVAASLLESPDVLEVTGRGLDTLGFLGEIMIHAGFTPVDVLEIDELGVVQSDEVRDKFVFGREYMHIGRLRVRETVIRRDDHGASLSFFDKPLMVDVNILGILVALVGHVSQDCDEHRARWQVCAGGREVCAFIYE